jgi:hypothetical protein
MAKVRSFTGVFAVATTLFALSWALAPSVVEGGEAQPTWIEVHSSQNATDGCLAGYSPLPMLRRVPTMKPFEAKKGSSPPLVTRCGRLTIIPQLLELKTTPQTCHPTTNPFRPQGECPENFLCLDGLPPVGHDAEDRPVYACGMFYLPNN